MERMNLTACGRLQLTSQNRWLRDIISEKAEVNPHLGNALS